MLSMKAVFGFLIVGAGAIACGSNDDAKTDKKHGTHNEPARPVETIDSVQPVAAATDGYCGITKVKKIVVDRNYTDKSGGTFTYSFQFIPPTGDNPTIVYIPGGPGQTSIGDADSWKGLIPDGYGLILTDPRGVGCNKQDAAVVGPDFYKSSYVARDILSAVSALRLDNYSLYGISYGTLVATMAASLAEREWQNVISLPKSVVLEGVVGRTFRNNEEAGGQYDAILARTIEQLRSEVGSSAVAPFVNGDELLGYNMSTWGQAIQTSLMLGSILDGSGGSYNVTYELIRSALSKSFLDQRYARRFLSSFTTGGSDDDSNGDVESDGSDAFYYYVACQEVFPNQMETYFAKGSFQHTSRNYCEEGDITLDPFYASDWPITQPIYYLQGADDPATPAKIAYEDHFAKQPTSRNRQFLEVKEAGHNPFSFNMEDCIDPVWNAMTSNQGFRSAVENCSWLKIAGFDLRGDDGALVSLQATGLALQEKSAAPLDEGPTAIRSGLIRKN